jgi:polyisoprenoid-binding protein YceI
VTIAAQPLTGVFEVDRKHSWVGFAVRHMQVSTFRGSFREVDARVVGDASGLHLEGAVRVESISITDPPDFRAHVVRGDDFFDAERYPEITFRSTRADLAEDGAVTIEGELTIKGISRTVVATGTYQSPVADPWGSERAALELHAVVDRRDWELSWQLPLPDGGEALGWSVDVHVQLELVRQG